MHLVWYDKIKTIATNYDAKFIDLATVKDYDASMFLSCDGHWNKKGHRLAGNIVSEYICNNFF